MIDQRVFAELLGEGWKLEGLAASRKAKILKVREGLPAGSGSLQGF